MNNATGIYREHSILVLIMALLLLSCVSCRPVNSIQIQEKNGTKKVWPQRLRGLCIGKPRQAATTKRSFERMASWNVNVVTVNMVPDSKMRFNKDEKSPSVPAEMQAYRGSLGRLDKILALAKEYRIYVVLCAVAVGADNRNVAVSEATKLANYVKYIRNTRVFWSYIAKRYKDDPMLIAYHFISEPHTKMVVKNWHKEIVPDLISTVREHDINTYLVSKRSGGLIDLADELPIW